MSAELRASRNNATLILTLSNPSAKNALHPDIYAAAIEALSTAERDNTVRAVILTGADNFFCSGGNLKRLLDLRRQGLQEQVEELDQLQSWIETMRGCPKPIIAAVDGAAVGTGFSLALACDFIVAGSGALFQAASVKVGLTPDGGSSWFLTRALPHQLATEMMLEGKPIGAERLHQLGIVNKLVQKGAALQAAMDWADELAELVGDGLGRRAIVAGQHDDADALVTQGIERRHCRRLDWIGHRNHAGELAIDSNEEDGGTVFSQRVGARLEIGAGYPAVLEQRGIADGDISALGRPDHTLTGDGREIRDLLQRQLTLRSRRENGGGKRMFA